MPKNVAPIIEDKTGTPPPAKGEFPGKPPANPPNEEKKSNPSGDMTELTNTVLKKAGVQIEEKPPEKKEEKKEEKKVEEKKTEKKIEKKEEEIVEIPDDVQLNKSPEKKEEKKEEKVVIELDESKLDKKAAEAFKAMRERIEELEKKTAPTAANEEELTTLRKEVGELRDRQSIWDLQNSPRFKKEFDEPVTAQRQAIVDLIKEFGGTEEQAVKAAKMKIKDRFSFLSTEIPDAAAILMPMYSTLDQVTAKKLAAMKDHQTTAVELQKRESEQKAEMQTKLLDSTIAKLREKNHFLLNDSKANPKWLEGIKQNARSIIMGDVTPEQMVEFALKAQVADGYKSLYVRDTTALRAKIVELENDLSQYKKIKRISQPSGDHTEIRSTDRKGEPASSIDDLVDRNVAKSVT